MNIEEELYKIFGYYDSQRFFHLKDKYYTYICVHPQPSSLTKFDELSPIRNAMINETTTVEIRYFRNGVEEIHAGKCQVCGKVYYL